jgi:DNA-binding HxlR family transcriptional regulator
VSEQAPAETLSRLVEAMADDKGRGLVDAAQVQRLEKIVRRQYLEGTSRSAPAREMLTLSGNKWTVSILRILASGVVRHCALQRVVAILAQKNFIAHRVLDYNLLQLERNGLVARRVTKGTRRKRVEYELTTLGQDFLAKIEALMEWAEDNSGSICRARDNYQLHRGPYLARTLVDRRDALRATGGEVL